MAKTRINVTEVLCKKQMKIFTIIFAVAAVALMSSCGPRTEIYSPAEEVPSYPGGDEALIKFLQETLKYPEEAIKHGVHGKVFVTFIVEVDGSLSDVKVARGIGHGCDEEAIRVVKSMPKWIPGKQLRNHRFIPVRIQYILPIKFEI